MSRVNLKELSKQSLESFLKGLGAPAFRARQLLHWLYEKHAADIQEITELSKEFRLKLSEVAYIGNLSLLDRKSSSDGTEKYLFGLEDGESVESVLIPDDDRLTLCISSQAGCALGCRFCLTGAIGLRRNLKPHEVVDQVISVSRAIRPCTLTNVVMMGMGEPLANFDNVIEALWRLTELVKISPRRVTLSTAGIVPKIIELARKGPKVNLAISLNATTDEVRDRIMPVNRAHPLRELLKACREFPLPERRRITFEYVLLKGVNDSIEDAHRLAKLLKGIPSKVNLIPFNPYEGSEFERPGDEVVAAFQEVLLNAHMTALVRKSKGRDISAACGQLRAGREAGLYT
jgi:23S rRNA (adenine2503-C2)-methyltransferase